MTPYTTDIITEDQLSFTTRIFHFSNIMALLTSLALVIILTLYAPVPETNHPDLVASVMPVPTPSEMIQPQILTGADLKTLLHKNDLWDIEVNDTIAGIVIDSFPDNLATLNVDDKKRIFLHTLLPIALTANAEVDRERLRLFDILASSGALPGNFKLKNIPKGWKAILSNDDRLWLKSLEDRYNATDIRALKKRMRRIPVSLIMAQGALESSWGTSRFAREGNNLFGLRTWGAKGITPEDIDNKDTYRVASYESLLGSVRAYMLTLNSHRLYSKFRDLRLSTQDPIVLSKGLIYYSERRKEYVSQVNRIIKYNSLKKFDTVRLEQKKALNPPILLSKN